MIPARRRVAAWVLLLVTLASGALLRVQWTGAVAPWFDSRFLLHAHSHVALLGWTFVGIFTLVLAGSGRGARSGGRPPGRWSRPVGQFAGEGLVLALILAIFVVFLFQGYGFWSILLSTLHVAVTLVLVGWYALRGRRSPWLDLAMGWLVLSNLGPLLLGAGAFMGPGWTDAWVGYYLTITFNGWLTFAAIGLLVERGGLSAGAWARRAMALGVIPTAVPALASWFSIPMAGWIGWGGGILFGGGAFAVGLRMLASVVRTREGGGAQRLLGGSTALALCLAGTLVMIGGFPSIAPSVADIRMLLIGFVHLQLLGFVTGALVLLLFRPGWPAVAPFLAGSWSMVAVLIGAGVLQWLGRDVFGPLAETLAASGVLVLIGAALIPRGGSVTFVTASDVAGCEP